MISRALRVSEDHEGKGVTRQLKQCAEQLSKEHGAVRKSSTIYQQELASKFQERGSKLVFTKKVSYFAVRRKDMEHSDYHSKRKVNEQTSLLTKNHFKQILNSKALSSILFPENRIVADWVPYRILESNVDILFDHTTCLVSSGIDFNVCNGTTTMSYDINTALLTLGVSYCVEVGVVCNIDIQGSYTEETLLAHLRRHIERCLLLEDDTFHVVVYSHPDKHDRDILSNVMKRLSAHLADHYCTQEWCFEDNL